MPISTTMPTHRLRHIFRRRHQNLVLFILKCAIMFAVISLFLFFLGFAALILLHFILVPNNRIRRQNNENKQQLLPDVVYTESEFKDSSSDTCAICLDSFNEGDVSWFLPDCKHLFHARCVDKWILKRPTCPVCRTRVSFDASRNKSGVYDDDDHWKRLWTTSHVNFHEEEEEGVSSYYN